MSCLFVVKRCHGARVLRLPVARRMVPYFSLCGLFNVRHRCSKRLGWHVDRSSHMSSFAIVVAHVHHQCLCATVGRLQQCVQFGRRNVTGRVDTRCHDEGTDEGRERREEARTAREGTLKRLGIAKGLAARDWPLTCL